MIPEETDLVKNCSEKGLKYHENYIQIGVRLFSEMFWELTVQLVYFMSQF